MADTVKIIDSQQAFDDLTKLSSQLLGIEKQINGMATAASKMNASLQSIQSITDISNRVKELETAQRKANDAIDKATEIANKKTSAEKALTDELKRELKAMDDVYKGIERARKARLKEADSIERNKKALDRQRQSYLKATEAADKMAKSSSGLRGMLGGLSGTVKSLVAAFGLIGGVQMFANLVKDAFDLTKKLNSMSFAMKTVIKDDFELGQTQEWLSKITRAYGAELVTTTNRYIKFRAASEQAGFTAAETQRIFGTMTKAAGVLGLKTDELTGIYLALEQMISKGKITTEELRRQLGERLPGAMDIMAKSMGVTTSELDKMMKKGEVLTKDVLPAFARQVEIAYGIESVTKVETLTAATTNLGNAWTELIAKLEGSEGGISSPLMSVLNFITSIVEQHSKWQTVLDSNLNSLVKTMVVLKGLNPFQQDLFDKTVEALQYEERRNELRKEAIKLAKEYAEKTGEDIDLISMRNRLWGQSNDGLSRFIDGMKAIAKTNGLDDVFNGLEQTVIETEFLNDSLFGSIYYLDKVIAEYKKMVIAATDPKMRESAQEQLDNLKELKKALEGLKENKDTIVDILPKAGSFDLGEFANNLSKEFKVSKKIFDDEFKKFLENPDMDIDDFKDKMKEIAEAVEGMNKRMQESFDQFADTTNMFFDNRIERIEQDRDANEEYYDNLIGLAEGNEDEQKRLEFAKEARDKELREKQNEAAKKQAIFNQLAMIGVFVDLPLYAFTPNK